MPNEPILTALWDYGWLHQDTVELAAVSMDSGLIEQYVASTSFQTTFLEGDSYETGIHGPFPAERIHADDFVPLEQTDLASYLDTMGASGSPVLDASQRAEVLPLLAPAFARGRRCYVLRHDERSRELFHEWGHIFWLFREFLFVGPERDRLERFVIGYD